jgi:hypothetical protein
VLKIKKRAKIPALLCALLLLLTLPAFAAQTVCSLTLHCAVDGSQVPGVVCRLYRVAALNGTAFTPTAAFTGAQVKLNGLADAAGWQTAADSLAVYATAEENGIEPDGQGTSDGSGNLSFAGLSTGLYLAVFAPETSGSSTYRFSPDLLALPQWDAGGTVTYDGEAAPKGTVTTHSGGGGDETTDITVLKVWNDAGETARRPDALSVTLLCDGKTYAEQELTEANNWRYRWDGLPEAHVWAVLERDVPEGYTVSYTAEGTILTITNQVTTDIPDTPSPGGNVPQTPVPGQTIPQKPVPKASKLPQTGQLWWPVPVLTAAGLALFAAGWHRKNEGGHEA